MKNIFLSVVVIAALAVAGVGGTLAQWQNEPLEGDYLWDAGFLNLVVDIEGRWLEPVRDAEGDLSIGDLINEDQLMPGDTGHRTFSLHAFADPATGYHAHLTVTGTADNFENGVQDPELAAGDDLLNASPNDGELADFLVIKLWWDEGLTPGWDNSIVDGQVVGPDPEEGDNIYQHPERLIYWGVFADLITDNALEPQELELDISTTYYIGLDWTLADYATPYGHTWDSFTPSPAVDVPGNVNQAMTDSLDGVITLTISGPYPDGHIHP